MVKAYIVDTDIEATGRRKVRAILQFAREESLDPREVGLSTIDSIVLSPQSIQRTQQSIPIGSVGNKFLTSEGSAGPLGRIRGSGPGSTITLRWATGSSGTRLATVQGLGTAALGTRTAHADIYGS